MSGQSMWAFVGGACVVGGLLIGLLEMPGSLPLDADPDRSDPGGAPPPRPTASAGCGTGASDSGSAPRDCSAKAPRLLFDDLVQQLLRLEQVDAAGQEIEQAPHRALLLDLLVDDHWRNWNPRWSPASAAAWPWH